MSESRRDLLAKTLFGSGYIGLRALATGVPAAFLSRPLAATAQELTSADPKKAQYLIISTSNAGDPSNANVPGTYDFPNIAHAADPRMAPTPIQLGAKTYTAAQLWSTLPPWALARTSFFHHGTLTNNHSNLGKVMTAMGATNKQEMLPSIFAKALAPVFKSIQVDPVSAGAGDFLTIDGRSLPNVAPTGLRDLLTRPDSALNRLQKIRDQSMDELHKVLKDRGTAAQKNYLDRLAFSRQQSRSLADDLLGMLAAIKSDASDGQVIAAVALIKMNVSPVIAIRLNFGGDNHTDPDLMRSEVPQHETGILRIVELMNALKANALEDRVTFAMYNVFGRTLAKLGTAGRDHWGSHHATLMIGKNVRPGVVGWLEPKANDYYATPIDSKTGMGVPGGGDIPFGDTLASMGKTLGAVLGVSPQLLQQHLGQGKIVTAAVA